jgi:hypothetical protein
MIVYNESKEGLFGSSLNWVNARLPYLYKNKIYPSWDIRNINHGDPTDKDRIIPHIIKPKQEVAGSGKRVNLLDIERHQYTNFKDANFYFNHYFTFNKDILTHIPDNLVPKKCLGIHFRGTDKLKNNGDCDVIRPSSFLSKLNEFLKKHDFKHAFVISDSPEYRGSIKDFVTNFGIKVCSTDFLPHFHKSLPSNPDKLSITRSSIIEMLLLSKCDHVIKSHSAFSSWAKIINPEINMHRVNKCKNDWFPDYYLPEF